MFSSTAPPLEKALRDAAVAEARSYVGVTVGAMRQTTQTFPFTVHYRGKYIGTFKTAAEAARVWCASFCFPDSFCVSGCVSAALVVFSALVCFLCCVFGLPAL